MLPPKLGLTVSRFNLLVCFLVVGKFTTLHLGFYTWSLNLFMHPYVFSFVKLVFNEKMNVKHNVHCVLNRWKLYLIIVIFEIYIVLYKKERDQYINVFVLLSFHYTCFYLKERMLIVYSHWLTHSNKNGLFFQKYGFPYTG